jgi:DNA polymerase bacteriophage-type
MKTPDILFIDFETGSTTDISGGAWLYSQAAHIILISYRLSSWKKRRVEFVKNFDRKKLTARDMPDVIKKHRGPVVAHSWSFEHAVFTHCLPFLKHYQKPENFLCTAAAARRHGLPGALYDAARTLALPNQKDKAAGSKLIQLYSIPNKKTGEFNPIPPAARKEWCEYGRGDILAMENIFTALPRLDLEPFEGEVFRLDQKINLRGLHIDLKSVEIIRREYEKIIADAERQAEKLCGREPSKTLTIASPAGFKRWLKIQGEPVPNAQAATLDAVAKTSKNKSVLTALNLRKTMAAAAPKKLYSMAENADTAGVIRHGFFYNGGHTGRWAGRGAQFHNFPRNVAADWKKTFATVAAGRGTVDDINSLLRGCIVPGKGKAFIIGDFSAIEARGLFWLADCREGLAAFRRGADLYVERAMAFYGLPADKIDKAKRQIGKAQILGLGYGMGAERFIDYAATYGISLTAEQAEQAVRAYRGAFPEVARLWRDCENAFRLAVATGSASQGDGPRRILWSMSKDKKFMRVSLPSGRALYYFKPFIDRDGVPHVVLPRGGFQKLWGGVIVENLIQSECRNILADAMLRAEAAGLEIVGTVHDEIICEVNKTGAKTGLAKLQKIMSTAPTWAAGFPLGAECHAAQRYGK